MLKLINIILIIAILTIGIYLIKNNYAIANLHYHNEKLIKEYTINKHINKQLLLEIENKSSNIHIKNYAIKKLEMFKPKIIRTID